MQRGIVTIQRVIARLQRVDVNLHRGVALLQRGIVNMQRGVVTAHRLVAGLHQGKAFLRCPEQKGRREKTCSQCVISLDMQHKITQQRSKEEIHQAKDADEAADEETTGIKYANYKAMQLRIEAKKSSCGADNAARGMMQRIIDLILLTNEQLAPHCAAQVALFQRCRAKYGAMSSGFRLRSWSSSERMPSSGPGKRQDSGS